MNRLSTALLFLLGLALHTSADTTQEKSPTTIHFSNGDRLSGKVLQLKDNVLSFKSNQLTENAKFNAASLLEVNFVDTAQASEAHISTANHVATISLEDRFGLDGEHGLLKGQIQKIDPKFVTLDTWYAGTLQVDRSLIHEIKIEPNSTNIYSGPLSLTEWTQHGSLNAWSYSNQSLVSSSLHGSLAQDIKLPNKAVMRFQLKWRNFPSLSLHLYADSVDKNDAQNYYSIQLQNRHRLVMAKRTKKHSRKPLNRDSNTSLRLEEQSADIAIFMDKTKGVFHVFINDEHINSFTDRSPTPEKLGSAIYIRNDNGTPTNISNIRLSKWSGTIPTKEGDTEQELTGSGQKIHLANGDTMLGDITNIEDETLFVKTPHGDLQVALAGVRELNLKPLQENHPKADTYDLKAHFRSGGWIIIDTTSIDKTHIYGNNQAIGDCKFRLDAFRKIELNIYSRSHNAKRTLNSW